MSPPVPFMILRIVYRCETTLIMLAGSKIVPCWSPATVLPPTFFT